MLSIFFTIALLTSQAQGFNVSTSIGYLKTRAIDKERLNYSTEITGLYRFSNHIVVGTGLSFMKTGVIWSYRSVSPLYDRNVFTLFATAGYDYMICKNLYATPNLDVGISWIEAQLSSHFPSERNERFSPFLGVGCDIGYRFRNVELFLGLSYYLLFDNHQFNPDQTILTHDFIPQVDKYWHHFCFKMGVSFPF